MAGNTLQELVYLKSNQVKKNSVFNHQNGRDLPKQRKNHFQRKENSLAPPGATPLPLGSTLFFQRNLGNLAVQKMLETKTLQAKLKINQPNDKYEREADRVADQVMRRPESEGSLVNNDVSLVQRQSTCPECEEEEERIQTKGEGSSPSQVTADIESHLQSLKEGGQSLSTSTRSFFEPRFEADFSQVRLHTDPAAAAAARKMGARAFTVGQDLFFGTGQYNPGTIEGDRLLAHELTHVKQQGAASPMKRTSPDQVNDGITRSSPGNHPPVTTSKAPPVEGRSFRVQRVRWEEGEVPPMFPDEFRRRVISEIGRLISFSVPQTALNNLFDPATGVPALVRRLDNASQRSLGLRHAEQLQSITATANELLRMFILDPNLSILELLTPAERTRYRDFAWNPNDYPGGPAGPNEGRALAMAAALSAIRPERRANSGAEAVVTRPTYTPQIERYITGHLQAIPAFPVAAGGAPAPVQPAGHQLLDEARDAFVRMRDAAWADGVALIVIASYRAPAVARARAAAAAHPAAVAAFSSHSLGLAVDLRMSFTYQTPAGPQNRNFAEATTRPMQDVVNMRQSPAHKWLFLRGLEFGWYPFQYEPWHWEYNPPGFGPRFRRAATPPPAP